MKTPKRGRPKVYDARSTLTVRLTKAMRKRIEKSAQETGRSLSEEIEMRLEFGAAADDIADCVNKTLIERTEMIRAGGVGIFFQESFCMFTNRGMEIVPMRDPHRGRIFGWNQITVSHIDADKVAERFGSIRKQSEKTAAAVRNAFEQR